MRKIFFILSFLELQFVAHAQTNYNKDAWELYMKLETMTAQLHEKGNAWTDKFNELYKVNKNYDQLTPLRKNIAHFIDSSIAEITNMKDKIPGSNDLRAGYIKLFALERVMVQKAYIPFEHLGDYPAPETITNYYKYLAIYDKKEERELDSLDHLKLEYAKKNKLEIESSATDSKK